MNTGYTPETPQIKRLENLTATAGIMALMAAAAESNGDPNLMERILTGKALAELNRPETTQAALEARLDAIYLELMGPVSKSEADALITEAAEITAYLEREFYALSDAYDARVCAKRGESL